MEAKRLRRYGIAFAVLMSTAMIGPEVGYAQSCVPACRVGFVCVNATCVSACNPACPPGQMCTADAQCVPDGSAVAAPVGPAPLA